MHENITTEKILKALEEGPATVKELEEKLNMPIENIRVYIHRLIIRGKVKRIDKKGHWVVYSLGKEIVSKPVTLKNKKKSSFIENDKKIKALKDLVKRLVLLMLRAGINSDQHDVPMSMEEITPYYEEIVKEGMI